MLHCIFFFFFGNNCFYISDNLCIYFITKAFLNFFFSVEPPVVNSFIKNYLSKFFMIMHLPIFWWSCTCFLFFFFFLGKSVPEYRFVVIFMFFRLLAAVTAKNVFDLLKLWHFFTICLYVMFVSLHLINFLNIYTENCSQAYDTVLYVFNVEREKKEFIFISGFDCFPTDTLQTF